MRSLSILGSTGSVGRQCLQVVEDLRDRFRVVALAAGNNVEQLAGQVARFQPDLVSVASAEKVPAFRAALERLGVMKEPEIRWGADGLRTVATHPGAEMVVSAAVGVVGLDATYKALQSGKSLALANKEVLVVAGELVTKAAQHANVEILPVDSEHNAVHQCLRSGHKREVKKLFLTGSGGPFLKWPYKKLARATPKQALNHPQWKMGKRITVDSATLMNKGLELIEAHWLFGLTSEQVEVVIHPQAIIHSLVEFVDGSTMAQLAPPDMRVPLQYALTFPDRLPSNTPGLDLVALKKLDFRPPDEKKFPCLGLARQALVAGGSAPCILNAADEVAVGAFLEKRIKFLQIPEVIERVLEASTPMVLRSIDDVLDCDKRARIYTETVLERMTAKKRKLKK